VLYGVLTSISYLLLFGVVFWSTTHYMERQIDASVAGEIAEIQAAVRGDTAQPYRNVVGALIERSPDYFYLLQDSQGRVLAGNLPATEPIVGIRQWTGNTRHRHIPFSGIRGQGIHVNEGAYLFVGLSTVQLHKMEELVIRAFMWGLTLALLVSVAGGAALSLSFLRRIEAVSQTSREIVRGDLQRRIPERGSGDEFDHLAASLNTMLDRIQALMEGLRQVSNDIAHDLRTPLTRLRQRLELALRRGPGAGDCSVIERALRDIDSILETFGALLRIAQIESGVRKAGFADVDLGDLLHNVVEIYQSSVEDREHTLSIQIDTPLYVRGDRELLIQLFGNLLDNAVRHSPRAAHLELRARRQGDLVSVSVSDTGPGIPPELRKKVLQRFFRLEGSRSTPGSGLGLSLAEAVARLHESELVLEDNTPGLRVTVALRSA
jgi:signal transduction histidine kinase